MAQPAYRSKAGAIHLAGWLGWELINPDVYREISDILPSDLLAERAASFGEEIASLCAIFARFDADDDLGALSKAVHKLAGGAAVFGAEPLHGALSAIEIACRCDQRDVLPRLRNKALDLANRTYPVLRKLAVG